TSGRGPRACGQRTIDARARGRRSEGPVGSAGLTVAKTEEKPKKKKPARPKKGLHGWKAALTVFGCGTLAAFGVFGILVGVASMFFGFSSGQESMTSPEEDPIAGIGQTAIPRDSTGTGDIDLCGKTIHQVDEV